MNAGRPSLPARELARAAPHHVERGEERARRCTVGSPRHRERVTERHGVSVTESLFRTTKYRPEFPSKPFESLEQARCWMTWFEGWYNTEHLHSALKFVTPAQRHAGEDIAILERRAALYKRAMKRNPKRWSKNVRDWTRVEAVVLNPQPSAAELQSEAA